MIANTIRSHTRGHGQSGSVEGLFRQGGQASVERVGEDGRDTGLSQLTVVGQPTGRTGDEDWIRASKPQPARRAQGRPAEAAEIKVDLQVDAPLPHDYVTSSRLRSESRCVTWSRWCASVPWLAGTASPRSPCRAALCSPAELR
jgi:hypothetical protein